MTLADGESVIRETIFENRFMHAPELAPLGADIVTSHGRRGAGEGRGRHLTGAQVMATDLRASVSLSDRRLAARGRDGGEGGSITWIAASSGWRRSSPPAAPTSSA